MVLATAATQAPAATGALAMVEARAVQLRMAMAREKPVFCWLAVCSAALAASCAGERLAFCCLTLMCAQSQSTLDTKTNELGR